MVEVFKTDVTNQTQATMLVNRIHKTFSEYKANFDLDDCDNILRVCTLRGEVQTSVVISFLNDLGFHIEVLEDDLAPADSSLKSLNQFNN